MDGGRRRAIVVFSAIGFFIPVFADAAARGRLWQLNAPIVAVYVTLAGLVLTWRTDRRVRAALDRGGSRARRARAPAHPATAAAPRRDRRRRLGRRRLRLPGDRRIAYSWGFTLVAAATTWLGGETTCALAYLLYERSLRSATARALAARRTDGAVAPGVRAWLVMAWSLGTGRRSTGLALAAPPTEVVRLLNRFFRVVVDAAVLRGRGEPTRLARPREVGPRPPAGQAA